MTQRRNLTLVILLVLLAPALGSCREDDEDIRQKLSNELGPYQEQLDFALLLPAYIPNGTADEPQAELSDRGLNIYFAPSAEPDIPPERRAGVEIVQTSKDLAPPGGVENPALERRTIRGREVIIERYTQGAAVHITLQTRSDGVTVIVSMDWDSDETMTLSHEMEQEAFKVLDSMLSR
jgi:hypothetical protein